MTINIIVIIEEYYEAHDDSPFLTVLTILLFWPIILALCLIVCAIPILNVVMLFQEIGRMKDGDESFLQKCFSILDILLVVGGIVFDCCYLVYGCVTHNWSIIVDIFKEGGKAIENHYATSGSSSLVASNN